MRLSRRAAPPAPRPVRGRVRREPRRGREGPRRVRLVPRFLHASAEAGRKASGPRRAGRDQLAGRRPRDRRGPREGGHAPPGQGAPVPPRRAPGRRSARVGIRARALHDALPRAEGLSPHPRPSRGSLHRGGTRGRRALARECRVHGLDAAPLREEPPRVLDRARRAGSRGPHRGRRHGGGDARGRRRRGPALARRPRPAAPRPARGGESPVRERGRPRHVRARLDGGPPRRG